MQSIIGENRLSNLPRYSFCCLSARRQRDRILSKQPADKSRFQIARPLFYGKQGKQKTEIHFDPASRMITIKLLVQDPNGYFIPNIRRDNFVVYENGSAERDG